MNKLLEIQDHSFKIAIVDSQPVIRESLMNYIKSVFKESFVNSYHSPLHFFQLFRSENPPHFVITDLAFPESEKDGHELVKFIKSYPINVIIYSHFHSHKQNNNLIENNVKAIISKSSGFELLCDALGLVLNGQVFIDPICRTDISYPYINPAVFIKHRDLNHQQEKFLNLFLTDMPFHMIPKTMNLSNRTTERYRTYILDLYGVDTRIELYSKLHKM